MNLNFLRFAKKLFHSGFATQFDRVNIKHTISIKRDLFSAPFASIELGNVKLFGLVETKLVHVIELSHDLAHLHR